jgi:hypothetical protein
MAGGNTRRSQGAMGHAKIFDDKQDMIPLVLEVRDVSR